LVDAHEKVGLPYRPFLYTLDQIAVMLSMPQTKLLQRYLYFDGRSTGRKGLDLMLARNIADDESEAEWRVAEKELLRWMKRKGFRHYSTVSLKL
jgi:hypothetical protein